MSVKSKGGKTMYSKPEVTKVAASLEAIQSGTSKPQNSTFDNGVKIQTPLAYEADE
jgi:hypothetical protein